MPKDKESLCFNCALIFETQDNETLVCPECYFTTERNLYERVLESARDAALFGYFYRKAFERNAEKGDTRTRYALAIDDIFIFLALAIVSGVVGNAAYDASKMALKRIAAQAHARYEQWGELTQLRLLENQEEVNRFVKYVTEFPQSIKTLPTEIRLAIVEEMLVDVTVERLRPDLQGISPEEFAKLRDEAFSESIIKIVNRLKSSPENMNHFWRSVPRVDNNDTDA